jgi:hypothetical protein
MVYIPSLNILHTINFNTDHITVQLVWHRVSLSKQGSYNIVTKSNGQLTNALTDATSSAYKNIFLELCELYKSNILA